MHVDIAAVREAADTVLAAVAADPRYARSSHLLVRVGGTVVVDEHVRGPERGDVFSVTKTVLALTLAAAAAQGLLPPLDQAVSRVLPELAHTPAGEVTWLQLLTMTRGAETNGSWDVDVVTALAGGQVRHIAQAPQQTTPGTEFAYDNGASHLLGAAATAVLGEPVSAFASRELFEPLGIHDPRWACDPDGVPFGYAHLHLTDDDLLLAAGWAGQHVLVVPASQAVVVTTGDPGFDPGPPARDEMPADWLPALGLVRDLLLPTLRGSGLRPVSWSSPR